MKREGWNIGFCLCAIIMYSVFRELNVINQAAGQPEIVCRLVLRNRADGMGQSKTIYDIVSSATKQIKHPMCLTIALM